MSWVLLVGMLALVVVNGFFVASEFALVRARRSRLEHLGDEDARALVVMREIDEISEYLSACQLGITLASIGIGFLGEPALAGLLEPLLGGLSHGAAVAVSLALAYAISTTLHITVGEQVPKIFAIARAERVALRIARPLSVFTATLRPAVVALNAASNSILRALGIDPDAEFEEGGTPEDIKLLIAQSLEGGQLGAGEATMLAGVFHLHEQQARHVMTPSPALVAVDVDADLDTASELCVTSGHTRLVVNEHGRRDHARGILHAADIMRGLKESGGGARIAPFVRAVPVVPETKALAALLADLRRERSSMAIVADEYGRAAGIVTVEDVLEEIVGDIADETDAPDADVHPTGDGAWEIAGHVPVADLADHGISLPEGSEGYNSVGGLVFAQLGRLPESGETLRIGDYLATVQRMLDNRVQSIELRNDAVAPLARADDLTDSPGDGAERS